ncbi:MAG TPA: ABC transporter permease [Tepidisphaeraceae bacterium]|nr:ABC transporter permease [Tepidisphaeraceae bacterium]
MNRSTALLWKEWHEVRLFLAIALFVFLGLPLIGAVENQIARHQFLLSASLWVFLLGGVLAVFVGVGTVMRDMNGRLEEFWRSRPVSVTRWLIIKYFVGLAVVFVSLAIPLIVEIAVNGKGAGFGTDPRLILAWSPFFWAAVYSLSFAVACLVRRGAHATMVSIAALLLIYFLPQIIRPLRYLGLGWVIDESGFPSRDAGGHVLGMYHRLFWMPWAVRYRPLQLEFAAAMLVLCVIGLALAVEATRQDWRVRAGRKAIYWLIGSALLVIFSAAAFQNASNLPLLQTVELPAQHENDLMAADGSNGVIAWRNWGKANTFSRIAFETLRIDPSGVKIHSKHEVESDLEIISMIWNPGQPDVLYLPAATPLSPDVREGTAMLAVIDMRSGARSRLSAQPIPDVPKYNKSSDPGQFAALTLVWHDRLYLLGPLLTTFDLSSPLKPRLLPTQKIVWTTHGKNVQNQLVIEELEQESDTVTLALPPVPGLPLRQRLELVASMFSRYIMLTGDILIRLHGDHLTTYRLDALTPTSATFRKLGRYDPTAAEKLFGSSMERGAAAGGLAFVVLSDNQFGGTRIAVIDVSSARPRPVGHFAISGESYMGALCPLPDGRLLAVGERRLYVLGPPPDAN